MTQKQKYIELIRQTPLIFDTIIELDNLDKAKLVEKGRGIEVLNEHNTRYPLEQLSLSEIKAFCFNLNIEPRFDYLILTEDNEWVSTGAFSTQSDLDSEIKELKSEGAYKDYNFVVFKADEMDSYNI